MQRKGELRGTRGDHKEPCVSDEGRWSLTELLPSRSKRVLPRRAFAGSAGLFEVYLAVLRPNGDLFPSPPETEATCVCQSCDGCDAQRRAESCIRSRQFCQLFRLDRGYRAGHDHVSKGNRSRPLSGLGRLRAWDGRVKHSGRWKGPEI